MPPSPEQSSLNPEGSEEQGKTKETSSEQKESDGDDRVKPKNFQEAVTDGPVNGGDGGHTQNISKIKDALDKGTLEELGNEEGSTDEDDNQNATN